MSASSPISSFERIFTLDVLRGAALLGILICNMSSFNVPWAAGEAGWNLHPEKYNEITKLAIEWLLSGKFNAIFSFLFGVGFTVLLARNSSQSGDFLKIYLRRLLVLFIFGVIHFVFIWDGDILHSYAILGLLLLGVHKIQMPLKGIFALAILLLFTELSHRYLVLIFNPASHLSVSEYDALAHEQFRIFSDGTYVEMMNERIRHVYQDYIETTADWWSLTTYGGTMLIGYIFGRLGIFQDTQRYHSLLKKITFWGLLIGLSCGTFYAYGIPKIDHANVNLFRIVVGVCFIISRLGTSLFYISAVSLLCQRNSLNNVMKPLAIIGRMPLTNYIAQSLICTTLFYSYGFGLYGQVGPTTGFFLALLIYAIQVAYSLWWTKRFRFGPLEWLWRTLSYGHKPLFKQDRRMG